MLKGMGLLIGAILAPFVPFIFIGAIGYFEWPKLTAYWQSREQAYALVPILQKTIAQDKLDLASARTDCAARQARAGRTSALLGKLTPSSNGQAAGLHADAIAELLAP